MKKEAYIFDIDGTLALKGDRSPYDYSKVLEDKPNTPIIRIASLIQNRTKILFVSGRPNTCYDETVAWLGKHLLRSSYSPDFCNLFMRDPSRDPVHAKRKDSIVKEEIYREQIEPFYDVLAVFDDRNQVVDMWRSLGLTCLQVAPGDF